ncbi:hypothetical protein EK21DRAFT_117875 [Setomelanomma holmii]|uniref:Uncharacterized protein n=1 Tax=Setomelanomma holmii TaxID=210430 RepID=A0A9P4GZ26_9PLEO|nr:hypothetical protein EK21DRAFT_117875 [Setomelanomma holmii]
MPPQKSTHNRNDSYESIPEDELYIENSIPTTAEPTRLTTTLPPSKLGRRRPSIDRVMILGADSPPPRYLLPQITVTTPRPHPSSYVSFDDDDWNQAQPNWGTPPEYRQRPWVSNERTSLFCGNTGPRMYAPPYTPGWRPDVSDSEDGGEVEEKFMDLKMPKATPQDPTRKDLADPDKPLDHATIATEVAEMKQWAKRINVDAPVRKDLLPLLAKEVANQMEIALRIVKLRREGTR